MVSVIRFNYYHHFYQQVKHSAAGSLRSHGASTDPAADAAQRRLPRGQRKEEHGTAHTTVTGGEREATDCFKHYKFGKYL